MKKSVYDLKFKEGKKVEIELRKTSFFKQYVFSYLLSMFMLILIGTGNVILLPADATVDATTVMVLAGFAALITLLFMFKRFDLIKQYYDEKNDK